LELIIVFIGRKTKYFGVRFLEPARQDNPVDDDELKTAIDEMLRDTRSAGVPALNERCRHPLMKTTNWDRILESEFSFVQPEKLVELADDPKDDNELHGAIRDACREYINLVHKYIYKASMASRRKILSGKSLDQVDARGFHGYQEQSTRDRCADRLARMICMLVRIRNDYDNLGKLLVDDKDLVKAIDNIVGCDDVFDESEYMLAAVHQVLHEIFSRRCEFKASYVEFMLYRFIIFSSMMTDEEQGYSFKNSYKISSGLSEVQFWGRSMVLMQLYIDEWSPGSPVTTEQEFESLLPFVTDGSHTPFNCVRELLRLLASIIGSQPELPQFHWVDDNLRTICSSRAGYAISLDHLSVMCSQLFVDASNLMSTKLLYGFDLTAFNSINLKSLHDEPQKDEPGYSFLYDPKNNFKSFADQFYHYIIAHCKGYFVEKIVDRKIVWNQEAVFNYLRACDEFHEHFLSLLHLTVGQPLRGEEASSLLLNKSANSISRSVYWHNGQILFLQTYHKGASKSGQGKYVARFVAPEHTRLVLTYLAIIRPFQWSLAKTCFNEEQAALYSHCLFVMNGKQVTGTKYSGILRDMFIKYTDMPIGVADYRG
jgi:hypothetical protein